MPPPNLEIGVDYVGNAGLTVRLNSLSVTEKTGSYEYVINYTLTNDTVSESIVEGTWKLYKSDGSASLNQFGFFTRLFPGDSVTRSYTFEELKSVVFDVLGYHSDHFFESTPPAGSLLWLVEV